MKNYVNGKGQLVRWESYERDKENLIVSKWQNHYCVVNIGKKTKTKKKEIAIRSYKVTKDESGEVHCNCISHNENNEVCKHMIAVKEKVKADRLRAEELELARQKEEAKKLKPIEYYLARW